MGCLFPIWAVVVISLTAVAIIVVIIIINRRWEVIKFFMFMRFNILPNDDGPENLDDMEFDAFVAYRQDYKNIESNKIYKYMYHMQH